MGYRTMVRGIDWDDNQSAISICLHLISTIQSSSRILLIFHSLAIKPENVMISKPVFFGASKLDLIVPITFQLPPMKPLCPNLRVKEYFARHYIKDETADELNEDLENWIREVVLA